MTNARDKLNEAKYFLKKMKAIPSDIDAFRYELTAFLNAARSVTGIMQKEFAHTPGFLEWYTTQQDFMEKHPVMKYLHRQRVLTVHHRPVEALPPQFGVTETITQEKDRLVYLTGTAATIRPTLFTTYSREPRTNGLPLKFIFEDYGQKGVDVIEMCEEDVKELDRIVTECEIKFVDK